MQKQKLLAICNSPPFFFWKLDCPQCVTSVFDPFFFVSFYYINTFLPATSSVFLLAAIMWLNREKRWSKGAAASCSRSWASRLACYSGWFHILHLVAKVVGEASTNTITASFDEQEVDALTLQQLHQQLKTQIKLYKEKSPLKNINRSFVPIYC